MNKLSVSRRGRSRALPLLLAATLTVAGVAFAGNDAMDDSSSDAALKAKVESALHADKALLARHIKVSVNAGVVRLGGFVERRTDIQLAKNDASSVAGVKDVKNEMSLKAGSGEGQASE